jgi:hypothetical protein
MNTTISKRNPRRRAGRLALALAATMAATLALAAAPALAAFGLESFDGVVDDPAGETFTQAGGHPGSAGTTFLFNRTLDAEGKVAPDGQVKNIEVELPPGLLGDPTAVPQCSRRQFSEGAATNCPPASQVGTDTLFMGYNEATDELRSITEKVYNLVPRPGTVAQFGFRYATNTVTIDAKVRSGSDYGVTLSLHDVPQAMQLYGNATTFWGVPADENGGGWTRLPFVTLPTACLGPQETRIKVDSWQHPDDWQRSHFFSHDNAGILVGASGCDRLDFSPSITARPTTSAADTPTGLEVDLKMPQNDNPDGLAEANLKAATVALPTGVAVSPSGANGLAACSPTQIGLQNEASPSCPNGSKIGTVEITTPLLPDKLEGGIYLAEQGNNPFGSLLAIYLVAEADGVHVKLAGHVVPDPRTGQLTTTFDDNPQLPFSELKLKFFGGPRAALKTPELCGTYSTTTAMTPWSTPAGAAAHPGDQFVVNSAANGGACPQTVSQEPNLASFSGGTVNPAAGAYSPLVVHVARPDGSQRLQALDVTLPPGLLGRLAGIPYCPDAQIAAAAGNGGAAEQRSPSCPAASRVGSVDVAAGPGSQPYHAEGQAYLAGPYKGAPLSLAVVTPAVAGPLDLGTVVVRAALHVDPVTAQIEAVSDPLPTILQGIPLDLRSIDIDIDRSRFTVNPTNCKASSLGAQLTSTTGQAASLGSPFRVGGCAGLRFQPKLKLALKGATGRLAHPALKAVLKMPAGGANIARAQVNLPHGEFLDQGNLNKTCTRPVLMAGNCPKSSIYGKAKAWTPLLDKPLQGPVYLVGGYGYKLPALVADLNGQIRVTLIGKVDSGKNRGIRNTFELVPDAPVSRFVLEMKGGKKYGLLENSENLCRASKARRRAIARFTGQNGKVRQWKPVVANQCKKKDRGR